MSQKKTEFVILGQPIPCSRPRVTQRGTFYPKKYREAKEIYAGQISFHFAQHRLSPFVGPVSLHIEFVHKRPKALRGIDRVWKVTRPDLDNLVKTVKDALSAGGAWADDSQCCLLYCIDNYGEPNEEPHTRVIMSEITESPSG